MGSADACLTKIYTLIQIFGYDVARFDFDAEKFSGKLNRSGCAPSHTRTERQLLNSLIETNSPSSFIRVHLFFVLIRH
jgi:hypothetical protein